ncbi:MAG: hypothetical protein LBM38_05050 [Clostridiales bacterium]|jgi:hypothetical protein|nr:hypothetical protein [Clostridiales bacterium]
MTRRHIMTVKYDYLDEFSNFSYAKNEKYIPPKIPAPISRLDKIFNKRVQNTINLAIKGKLPKFPKTPAR